MSHIKTRLVKNYKKFTLSKGDGNGKVYTEIILKSLSFIFVRSKYISYKSEYIEVILKFIL